ncbi:MAG: FtsX-like permease family protein [Lachnospiraceae bacterium]
MALFRHKYSDLFMCISFMVTFYLVFVVLSYMNNLINLVGVAEKHAYESECRLIFSPGEELPDFDKILEEAGDLHGVILAEDVGMAVDATGAEYFTSVVLYADEPYKLVADGKILRVDKSGASDVIIGDDFRDYVTEDNKFYLDGEEYHVVATEDGNGGEYAHSIITWYEGLSDFSKEKLIGAEVLSIKILSDKFNTSEVFTELKNAILRIYPDAKVYAEEISNDVMYDKDSEYIKFYLMIYVFCVVNCMVAAQFWVMERKREIAIRKAYGFSSAKLFVSLYLEFLKVASVSMVLCLIVKMAAGIFAQNSVFTFELSVFNLLFLIAAVFITSFGAILLPVYAISRAASVDQVIKKG